LLFEIRKARDAIGTPLVTRAITRITMLVAIVPVAMLVCGEVDKELARYARL
jgi:hypothetical protein